MVKNQKAQDALIQILREHGGPWHISAVVHRLFKSQTLNSEECRNPEAIIQEAENEGRVAYDSSTGCVSLVEQAS